MLPVAVWDLIRTDPGVVAPVDVSPVVVPKPYLIDGVVSAFSASIPRLTITMVPMVYATITEKRNVRLVTEHLVYLDAVGNDAPD